MKIVLICLIEVGFFRNDDIFGGMSVRGFGQPRQCQLGAGAREQSDLCGLAQKACDLERLCGGGLFGIVRLYTDALTDHATVCPISRDDGGVGRVEPFAADIPWAEMFAQYVIVNNDGIIFPAVLRVKQTCGAYLFDTLELFEFGKAFFGGCFDILPLFKFHQIHAVDGSCCVCLFGEAAVIAHHAERYGEGLHCQGHDEKQQKKLEAVACIQIFAEFEQIQFPSASFFIR